MRSSLTPDTNTMSASFFTAWLFFSISRQAWIRLSVSWNFLTSIPLQDRLSTQALAVLAELQITITWEKGLYLLMFLVSLPMSVCASMTGLWRLKADLTTELATASLLVMGFCAF